MKRILLPFLFIFVYYNISAQIGAGPATDCTSSIPEICPGGSYPAAVTGLASAPGASFSCSVGGTNIIEEQPAFFYFEAGVTGPLTIQIDPTDPFTGAVLFNPQDLDFMCWGPFSNTATMCNGLTATNLITCSYSPGATEYCFLPNVIAGQFYVILVTNWHGSQAPSDCNIQFTPDTSLAGGGFAGANATITPCSTEPPFNLISQLNGIPDGWGFWINASNNIVDSIFDPSSDPGGVYRYVIGGTTTCPGDTAWLTIDLVSGATMSITSSPTSCSGDSPLTLTGSPSGGTFSGNGVNGNIFTPDISLLGSNIIEYIYQANGCSDTVTQDLIVYESPTVLPANVITTNPTCFGYSDGTALVVATGGGGGYGYNWFGQNSLALPSGTFNYEVTDANNCTFTSSVTLYDPINNLGVLTPYNSSCYGDNSGAISITMNGGTTPPGTVSDATLGYCASNPNSAYIAQLTSNIEEVILNGDGFNINNNTAGTSDFYEDYTNNTGLPGEYADITEGLSYSVDVSLGSLNSPGAYQNLAGGKVFIDFNIDGDFDDAGEDIGIIPWGENSFASVGFTVPNTGAYGPTRMRIVAQFRSDANPNNIGPCDVGDLGVNGEPWFGATEDYSIVLTCPTLSATFLWGNGQTSDSIYNLGPGTYTVIITPSSGCSVQDQATITESDDISFNPTVTNVSCNSFTDGTVTLSPAGGMDNIYTPNWYGFDPLVLDNGTYNLTVTDNFGCSNDTTITISEPAYFSVDFTTSDNEICLNDFVTLNFDFNTGGVPPFSIDYTINGFAQTPIPCNTSGLLLEPASPSLGNNTYAIITITDGAGCEIQNTILEQTILVNPIPDIGIAISGTNPICFGDASSIFFTNINGTPPYNVAYNINGVFATENVLAGGNNVIVSPGITTTYTLDSVSDAKGCSSLLNANATLVVNELPELSWNVPSEVCDEDIVQMSFSFTAGASPWNIFYDVDGNSYSIPLSNSIDSISISPSSNSTYTLVSIIDNNNCINDLNEVLTISIFPLPSGEITGGGSICNDGSTADITINTNSGTPPFSIIYAYGVNTQLVSNAAFSHIISSNQIGIYSLVEITDSKGCVAKNLSGSAVINVNPLPEANIVAYPQPADIINPLIHFNDVSNGHFAGIWNFGDGYTDSTNFGELTHIYGDTGRYQVSLAIESDSGCFDVAYQTIIISPVFTVYIPNSFTPNNDLHNDYFLPILDGVSEYEFSIYNRIGQRVFSTNKTDVAWDGKVENSDKYATKGVYIYSLVLTDINGKLRTYEGAVTLIR